MTHRLYKPTTADIARVSQEIRVILPPEPDAPIGSMRRVQVLVPESPKLYAGIDKDPRKLGLNRSYKLPHLPPGAAIVFHLMPHQWIVAAAHEGFAEPGLIVEYLHADES